MEPSVAERSVINHVDYFTNGWIVASTAINITDTEVLTEQGRVVAYDYLVIATGHMDSVPKTKTERLTHYQEGKHQILFPCFRLFFLFFLGVFFFSFFFCFFFSFFLKLMFQVLHV